MRRRNEEENKNKGDNKEPRRFEVDTTQFNWEKRFIDPHIRMIWNSLIKVEPANRERGQFKGWRIYPDGFREEFTVGRKQ